MNIDEQYRAMLQDWNRFRAIRKQQPENRIAFQRELARLEQHLADLRDSVAPRPAGSDRSVEPTNSGESLAPTGREASVRPAGKVASVHTPPTEQDVQRFIEALDKTHLPGRPLQREPHEDTELSRVSPQWIVRLTGLATVEAGRVSQMLKQSDVDEHEVQRALDRLDVLVHRVDNPPPETPSTKPKAL